MKRAAKTLLLLTLLVPLPLKALMLCQTETEDHAREPVYLQATLFGLVENGHLSPYGRNYVRLFHENGLIEPVTSISIPSDLFLDGETTDPGEFTKKFRHITKFAPGVFYAQYLMRLSVKLAQTRGNRELAALFFLSFLNAGGPDSNDPLLRYAYDLYGIFPTLNELISLIESYDLETTEELNSIHLKQLEQKMNERLGTSFLKLVDYLGQTEMPLQVFMNQSKANLSVHAPHVTQPVGNHGTFVLELPPHESIVTKLLKTPGTNPVLPLLFSGIGEGFYLTGNQFFQWASSLLGPGNGRKYYLGGALRLDAVETRFIKEFGLHFFRVSQLLESE